MRDFPKEATSEQDKVLKGPPGLLFGLTLLIFLGAGFYFGQSSESAGPADESAIANEAALVERALEQENERLLERTAWPERLK